MTPVARVVAVLAGIVTLLLAGGALVRQAAMAADAGVSWPIAAWWADLTDRSSTMTIVAAAATTVVAVLLVVLAYRQVSPGAAPEIIEFSVPDGTARLSVPALRKALRRRFEAMLPGAQVEAVAVRMDDDGWSVRVEAAVPVCDLGDLHDAVLEAFRDDMRRVAAIDLVRLDVVVTAMRAPARKAS